MKNIVFLDCEFTNLHRPELLSLALVSADGAEHYVELDLEAPSSTATLASASDFVRHHGVLGQWGCVPGAAACRAQMAERTAAWLLDHIARLGQPVDIAHDYPADYALLIRLLKEADQRVPHHAVRPFNVNLVTTNLSAERAAEQCLLSLAPRGLARHHALADALALRAAYLAGSAA